MIFNMIGGGGGRTLYSLLTVTTDDDNLIGADVTVSATGADTESYTKSMPISKSVTFQLKQIGTYSITCGDIQNVVTVIHYKDYIHVLLAWDGVAYDNGEEFTEITGGWINNNATSFSNTGQYLRVVRGSTGNTYGTARTVKPVNFTGWNYLNLDGYYDGNTTSYGASFGYGNETEMETVQTMNRGRKLHSIDISGVDGTFYLHVGNQAGSNPTRAYKVWLSIDLPT